MVAVRSGLRLLAGKYAKVTVKLRSTVAATYAVSLYIVHTISSWFTTMVVVEVLPFKRINVMTSNTDKRDGSSVNEIYKTADI